MQMNIEFPGGSRVDATFGGFRVSTDQPERAGGSNTAPPPFDYFLASLGTCAGFYVLKFMEQRGLSTEGLAVQLSTTRDPDSGRVAEILLDLRLPAVFPDKYRRAIVHAVNQCAVKRHLENPPAFRTEVTVASAAEASLGA